MGTSLPELVPCLPPRWAPTGHAQTVLGHLLPSRRLRERGERIEVMTSDGDRLVGRWNPGRTDTVVHVFHGLGGDAEVDYMQRTAAVALGLGHAVSRMNHRGCGEGKGLARGPYHSGRGEDLAAWIAHFRRREPGKRHVAVGFSLGGCALLNLVTGRRGEGPPDAAIAVNAPLDLEHASSALRVGFNRVYDNRFVALLRNDVRTRRAAGLLARDYRIPFGASVRDFDAIFTSQEGGFGTRDAYYATCSPQGHLAAIRVPTVLLTAKDDPFVPYTDYAAAKLSPSCRLVVSDVGGHMGYLTAAPTPLGTRRWMDYALDAILRSGLGLEKEKVTSVERRLAGDDGTAVRR